MQRIPLSRWNDILLTFPDGHILQTREWAGIKASVGWQAEPYVWCDTHGNVVAAAMLLRRKLSKRLPWSVLYAPKGPLLASWENQTLRARVLEDLQTYARETGAIFLKIDPDVVLGTGVPGQEGAQDDPLGQAVQGELDRFGWQFSDEQVQFRNTVLLDLTSSEDDLLAAMKQKTRYNIRLAFRKGVRVRVGGKDDLPLLYRMYAETAARDGFIIRPREYYLMVWRTLMAADMAEPLIAEVEGEPVAAVVIFRFGTRAYYFYGMSTGKHRNKMPTYALQWEAIRRAKAAGFRWYDFWGAPDVFNEEDPMWGVFRFKQGFGATVVRTLGAWDFPARPMLYRAYAQALPRALAVTRWLRAWALRRE